MKVKITGDGWESYEVTQTNEDEALDVPYHVKGKKQSWNLFRNIVNPHRLFPVPEEGTTFAIRGVKWFKEIVKQDEIELIPC